MSNPGQTVHSMIALNNYAVPDTPKIKTTIIEYGFESKHIGGISAGTEQTVFKYKDMIVAILNINVPIP